MARWTMILALWGLVACTGDGGDKNTEGTDSDSGTDESRDPDEFGFLDDSPWPEGVDYYVDKNAFLRVDLSEGTVQENIDWAWDASNACFPGTQYENFSGAHVWIGLFQDYPSQLAVTAVPDSDVDVSLYMFHIVNGEPAIPPELGNVYCEAAYREGAGGTETLRADAIQRRYAVLIGVAGANEATSGEFTLAIETLE